MDCEGIKSRMRLRKISFKSRVSYLDPNSAQRDELFAILTFHCKNIHLEEPTNFNTEVWTLDWTAQQPKGH